jgi:glutamate dehydrogenase/leucine dehydrogenase
MMTPTPSVEKIIPLSDPAIGLSGFLAVHSTLLGPAFGGIRMIPYPNLELCRADAVRLAEAMTRKCAFHDIPGGGAKVALDRGAVKDRAAVMRTLGDIVESMDGSFFTATDTGTTPDDLDIIAERTRYVSKEQVTEATAAGFLHAIRAACKTLGKPLKGLRVAVQGLGAIGMRAAVSLLGEGASVTGSDTDATICRRAEERGVTVAPTDQILYAECDLLAPCALGGVIDSSSIGSLRCRMVVGAANNILAAESVAGELKDRDILFVPDFVSSGGGVIRGAWAHLRGTPGTDQEVDAIYDRTLALLAEADQRDVPPLTAALDQIRGKLEGKPGDGNQS